MKTLITLLSLLLLTACAGKGIRHCVDNPDDDKPAECVTTTGDAHADAFYAAQRERDAARTAERQEREARFAALAAACKSDDCVRDVSRDATFSDALEVASGARRDQPVQQFVAPPTMTERVLGGVVDVTKAAINPGFQYLGLKVATNGSVRQSEINAEREVGIVDRLTASTNRSIDANASRGPELYVGGNYGDTITAGNDMWGDQNRVGPDISTGAINTGVQIRNRGNLGDGNRQASPNDDSTTCEGPGCMGVNRPIVNPLPEPEEGE